MRGTYPDKYVGRSKWIQFNGACPASHLSPERYLVTEFFFFKTGRWTKFSNAIVHRYLLISYKKIITCYNFVSQNTFD
jgi:hypothetical protein